MNYAKLFMRRKDGLYQAKYKEGGKWKTLSAKDPKVLYDKLQAKKTAAPMTVGELIDLWYAEQETVVSYKTLESYAAPIRRIKAELGGRIAAELSAGDIQAFIIWISRRGYARRTVQLHRDILTMAYRWGLFNNKVTSNPAADQTIPKGLPIAHRGVPDDAALAAVKASAGVPFGLYAIVLLYTGLRRGEALALRYEDIDRKNQIMHVRRSVVFCSNSPEIKPPKTATGVRDVYFPTALLAVLPKGKTGWVFPGLDGELMTKQAFRIRWERYCETIGHQISSHQLRHYYATAMFEAGVPVLTAQSQLGHAQASTTMNIYTHLREQQQRSAFAQIEDYFAG